MTEAKRDARTIKLQLMLSPAELRAIDDWRYAARLPSRAEAVRRLIATGLLHSRDDAPSSERASDYDNR